MIAVDAGRATQVIACTGSESKSPIRRPWSTILAASMSPTIPQGARCEHRGSCDTTRDGSRYGTASDDSTAKIWSKADLTKPLTLKHPEGVFDIAFSPDGKTTATASFKGGIWLWNAETGQPLGEPARESQRRPLAAMQGRLYS